MTDAKSEKNVEEQMKDEGKKDQWWAAFPEPKASVPEITGDDLYEMFDEMDIKPEPRSFLLVDVRRTDWEFDEERKDVAHGGVRYQSLTRGTQGGTIRTSINLPAQSFYQSRKTLVDLCDRAEIKTVIFYCATCHAGASSGRGPRCANWMQDYINDVSKFGRRSALKVKILKGGIKGWVKEYEGSMMDGFQEDYWKQFKDQAKVESK
ncbi:Rhodanese/Cell cycle control phosphatase [Glarea lozoyensis ATCC 20868]|uniref:Rhodanese/Cell cycle control phosphatase n=1 Tax=Glarea lozoyensis (strain ATCC 20868 / MF5171) TaxID=1116229 RepID=S3DC71_GLAL2|nr:Rhodanese/Cell cycle control phosphatase [Glarea lozoyensis ATCC 20868]EPE36027.1 Rhodanese/Cell cycle control phosphatase [Glarea lozoyensis ATCC 20868]